jgi:hypothetical protein
MAIQLNKTEPIPEYNKDEYFKKFIPLIFEHAPEFESFSFRDLLTSLELSKDERLIFGNMNLDLRKYFVDNGFAIMDGSRKIILTESGRDKKNGTENKFNLNIKNDFTNSTISQFNQESDFSNSSTNINPTTKQEKKSLLGKFWKLITENKLVSGILLALITEEATVGKIWKFIFSLFQN